MDIRRKTELAENAIALLARHDDEDLAVRDAALARLEQHIAREREAAQARVAERVKAALPE